MENTSKLWTKRDAVDNPVIKIKIAARVVRSEVMHTLETDNSRICLIFRKVSDALTNLSFCLNFLWKHVMHWNMYFSACYVCSCYVFILTTFWLSNFGHFAPLLLLPDYILYFWTLRNIDGNFIRPAYDSRDILLKCLRRSVSRFTCAGLVTYYNHKWFSKYGFREKNNIVSSFLGSKNLGIQYMLNIRCTHSLMISSDAIFWQALAWTCACSKILSTTSTTILMLSAGINAY